MKLKFIVGAFIVGLFLANVTHAQESRKNKLIGLGLSHEVADFLSRRGILGESNTWFTFANATPGGTPVNAVKLDGANNLHLSAITGKSVSLDVAGTPVHSCNSAGCSYTSASQQDVFPAAAVVTPGVTYGAGLGTLTQRYNEVATAGPTSQFYELAAPTANIGKSFELVNRSANPAPIVPAAGVINATGALTPYACATTKRCTCTANSSAGYWCSSE